MVQRAHTSESSPKRNTKDIKQLWIGNEDEYLSKIAQGIDPNAVLVTSKNFENWRLTQQSGYTGLGDLPKEHSEFWKILISADIIHYCPPDHWIKHNLYCDSASHLHERDIVESLLIEAAKKVEVSGLEFITNTHHTLAIPKSRLTNAKQMWFAGDSFTYGQGVTTSQTYAHLISKSLNYPYSNLAATGTSIAWSADQILRSDIRSGDILIWGITNWERITYVVDGTKKRYTSGNMQIHQPSQRIKYDELFAENTLHQSLSAIEQVENFCSKINIQLVTWLITPHATILKRFMYNRSHFLNIKFDSYIDLGTDNQHPGPEQHKLYCKDLQKGLQERQIVL